MLADMELVEPAIVADIFCTGLADFEDLGDGNFRFTLYTKQMTYCPHRRAENVIVARYIMTHAAVMESIQMTMTGLGVSCCGGERLRKGH